MKTGDPSTEDLAWQVYTDEEKARMQFDAISKVTCKDDTELMTLHPMHGVL